MVGVGQNIVMHIFTITGPPGAGKSTLASRIAEKITPTLIIPVDDLRTWVKSGLADSVPWSDETERQFQIAEQATLKIAETYASHGFNVVIDHCRNLPTLNKLFQQIQVEKILLLPTLQTTLHQNATRTNKDFDPQILAETIKFTHKAFTEADKTGWITLTNHEEIETFLETI